MTPQAFFRYIWSRLLTNEPQVSNNKRNRLRKFLLVSQMIGWSFIINRQAERLLKKPGWPSIYLEPDYSKQALNAANPPLYVNSRFKSELLPKSWLKAYAVYGDKI
jgi:hypothetical protein